MSAGPACPLCGSAAPKAFVRETGAYKLYDCPDCGAGFCDPFKNPGPEYYAHNSDVYEVAVSETTDPMSFEYDEALALLAREKTPGARLLDVGCGAGGFLHRARALGYAVAGVEFNPARVAALRARGFEVFAGGLPAYARQAPSASYDSVCLFEILEHLDDAADWLDAAKTLLKPGGRLLVGTPNRDRTFDPFQGYQADIDNPPHHLTRWSADALTRLLKRRGFADVECRALGVPLPLAQFLLRTKLSLGLATRALGVDQLRHAPAAAAAPRAQDGAVRALVAAKESVLNGAVWAAYPAFRAACAVFGWQGVPLLASARKPA